MEFKIDLNTLLRSLFPALVITGLLFLFDDSFDITKTNTAILYAVTIVFVSIVFYAFYRGILYFYIIRCLVEIKLLGKCKRFQTPMLIFHKKIIEEVKRDLDNKDEIDYKKLESHCIFDACAGQIQNENNGSDYTRSIFNAFAHVQFMAAFIFLFFPIFCHCCLHKEVWWLIGISIVLFASGLIFDLGEADVRIAFSLYNHDKKYKKLTENIIKYWLKPIGK